MADSRARGSSFSHDPMATASCWITVSELLQERKRHPLFNSWVVLVQVVITTVFVDTRLSKTKYPGKRFQKCRQSCMLSTDQVLSLKKNERKENIRNNNERANVFIQLLYMYCILHLVP